SSYAARARASGRPRLARATRHDRPSVGVVDRRTDDPRPDRARAAHGAADPLDAEPPGPRAADEGDPAEVQGRPGEAERGVDEVLQGEQHQPGRVMPADAGPAPGLLRALL